MSEPKYKRRRAGAGFSRKDTGAVAKTTSNRNAKLSAAVREPTTLTTSKEKMPENCEIVQAVKQMPPSRQTKRNKRKLSQDSAHQVDIKQKRARGVQGVEAAGKSSGTSHKQKGKDQSEAENDLEKCQSVAPKCEKLKSDLTLNKRSRTKSADSPYFTKSKDKVTSKHFASSHVVARKGVKQRNQKAEQNAQYKSVSTSAMNKSSPTVQEKRKTKPGKGEKRLSSSVHDSNKDVMCPNDRKSQKRSGSMKHIKEEASLLKSPISDVESTSPLAKHESSPSKPQPSPSTYKLSHSKHKSSPSKHQSSPSKHQSSSSKHPSSTGHHNPSPSKKKSKTSKKQLPGKAEKKLDGSLTTLPHGILQPGENLSSTMAALLQAEVAHTSQSSTTHHEMDDVMSSGSESDWEDVEEAAVDTEKCEVDIQKQVPKAGVEITLQGPDIMRKKRKRGFDMQAWFKRQISRYERETQLEVHKVHLLCLLCHGFYRNAICNTDILRAIALSVIPSDCQVKPRQGFDIKFFSMVTKWFCQYYYIDATLQEDNRRLRQTLGRRLASRPVASEVEMVMMFVIVLRALGADARLVCSLQPVSHKAVMKLPGSKKNPEVIDIDSRESAPGGKDCSGNSKASPKLPAKCSSKKPEKGKQASSSKKSSQTSTKKTSVAKSQKALTNPTKIGQRPRRSSSGKRYKEEDSDIEEIQVITPSKKSKSASKKGEPDVEEISSGESDFEAEKSFRSPKSSTKSKKGSTKIVSSDSDDSVTVTKSNIKNQGTDWWVEAYAEVEKKWICVDCIRWRFNHPSEIEEDATKPLQYVVAYDNRSSVKDVTQRYASQWMSKTRKLRPDPEWWGITLLPYKSTDRRREEEEDLQIQATQLRKPLPTSITEYKNHPLYALSRHLLKFEAIYPESAVPLGYVRGEPVYSRDCVHVLHTRENWLKEARAVRVKEQPYKFVKARKKRHAPMDSEEPTAELFGRWQTEQYMPPPAFNGKVPRNEYGNVEMFQACMLPGGTVHLKVPGLNKVAKKLGIDCVPAMTGWDHHSGFAHPILDGFIVCEEFEETLLTAWEEDQQIQAAREQEKRQKRIWDNWKKLIRGLIIREKMKKRFNLTDVKPTAGSSSGKSTSPGKKSEKALDVGMSWPQNLQTEDKPVHPRDKAHLFPFEEL